MGVPSLSKYQLSMETKKRLSLYIADDHPIVIEGLKEVLKSKVNWEIKGIAHNGQQLIELLQHEVVDVVILDINMPVMNGIEATRWIRANAINTKIIILTMYPERTFADQLMKAGVNGCLMKGRSGNDLLEAIERVVSGKSYFDWIADFKHSEAPIVNGYKLSEREVQIIKFIADRKSNSEMAEALHIAEETIKTHRKNIFKKLNIHQSHELIAYALNNGII